MATRKSKKERLVARATATRRLPQPQRLAEPTPPKKRYQVVAVSLYTPEAEWVNRATQILRRAGNPKANRSLVVREAILRLQDDLADKSPEEVLRYFTDRAARRVAGA